MLDRLDIEQFLSEQGIDYRTEGKNIGQGCVGVCCPFCGDTSYHLGIFRDHKNWTCWCCNEKGCLYDLMRALKPGFRWDEIKKAVKASDFEYTNVVDAVKAKFKPRQETYEFEIDHRRWNKHLPPSLEMRAELYTNSLYVSFQQFVRSRRLAYDNLRYAECRYCISGKYAHRLIIPVYCVCGKKRELVSFLARDVTGVAKEKYLVPSGTKINDFLYFESQLFGHPSLILVEGVFDTWRLHFNMNGVTSESVRKGVVGTFGAGVTAKQRDRILDLCNRGPVGKDLIFCWDGDAYGKAMEEAYELRPHLRRKVKVVGFPLGEDPDSLGFPETMACIEAARWL